MTFYYIPTLADNFMIIANYSDQIAKKCDCSDSSDSE